MRDLAADSRPAGIGVHFVAAAHDVVAALPVDIGCSTRCSQKIARVQHEKVGAAIVLRAIDVNCSIGESDYSFIRPPQIDKRTGRRES